VQLLECLNFLFQKFMIVICGVVTGLHLRVRACEGARSKLQLLMVKGVSPVWAGSVEVMARFDAYRVKQGVE